MDNELLNLLEELFGTGNVEIITPNRLEKTIPDMLSNNPDERLRAEYQQLLIRYQKLCALIKKHELGKDKHEHNENLMKEQKEVMRNYLDILIERATQEGWDLL